MNKSQFFDLIMTVCDWESASDDEQVLAPLVSYLAEQPSAAG